MNNQNDLFSHLCFNLGWFAGQAKTVNYRHVGRPKFCLCSEGYFGFRTHLVRPIPQAANRALLLPQSSFEMGIMPLNALQISFRFRVSNPEIRADVEDSVHGFGVALVGGVCPAPACSLLVRLFRAM
jgi:hypothetical protein